MEQHRLHIAWGLLLAGTSALIVSFFLPAFDDLAGWRAVGLAFVLPLQLVEAPTPVAALPAGLLFLAACSNLVLLFAIGSTLVPKIRARGRSIRTLAVAGALLAFLLPLVFAAVPSDVGTAEEMMARFRSGYHLWWLAQATIVAALYLMAARLRRP
jgi:hypothetical protein